jgi:hypothetical protein
MTDRDRSPLPARYSRRGFLAKAGAGAGALALGGSASAALTRSFVGTPARSRFVSTDGQHFGRLFPNLPPFAPASEEVKKSLRSLGAQGGPLDAQDKLSAGPIELIIDPSLSANNPDNPAHTAGTTFVGQFIDHDVTFDTSSPLGTPTDPLSSPNGRTPAPDLDSLYGSGPSGSPMLYDMTNDPAKLLIGSGGLFEDLPRLADGTAIIADPRNDENLIIAGLHCAFILFHNRAVDDARANGAATWQEAFAEARRLTTWHYHWLVLHEFMPLFVGQTMVDDVLQNGRTIFTVGPGEAFMPVEFQGACYRFGHSMVRPSYRANLKGDNGNPFFGLIFDPARNGAPLRRLADLLRLRHRRRNRKGGGQAQQADRHAHLDAAVHAATGRDREPRPTDGAPAAEPPTAPHLEHALGAGNSRGDGDHADQQAGSPRAQALRLR